MGFRVSGSVTVRGWGKYLIMHKNRHVATIREDGSCTVCFPIKIRIMHRKMCYTVHSFVVKDDEHAGYMSARLRRDDAAAQQGPYLPDGKIQRKHGDDRLRGSNAAVGAPAGVEF